MKRLFKKAFGLTLAVAVSAAFMACKNETPEVESRNESVLSLNEPAIKAVAYPGVNHVSWQPVRSAASYVLYRYDDKGFGTCLGTLTYGSTGYSDADSKLQNGVAYYYMIEAVSKSDPAARSVVVQNNTGRSNAVKAIIPPMDTSAINLAAYESGFDGEKKTLGDTAEVKAQTLSASTVKMIQRKNDYVISFPTKAYLTYDIFVYAEDPTDKNNGLPGTPTDRYFNLDMQNGNAVVTQTIMGAGDFTVKVRARALNARYEAAEVLPAAKISVPSLHEGPATQLESASYTAKDTVRIVWKPAKINGKNADSKLYKIYREVEGSGKKELLKTAIKTGKSADMVTPVYYIEDKPETTVQNTYYVVISDGNGVFGTGRTAAVAAYEMPSNVAGSINARAVALDKDGLVNDLRITTMNVASNTTVTISWVKMEQSDLNAAKKMLDTDYTKVGALKFEKDGQKEGFISNLKNGYYVVRAELKNGDDTTIAYANPVQIQSAAAPLTGAPETEIISATYTDKDTIRIVWKPAKIDGKDADSKWYKLYRRADGSNKDELLNAVVKTDKAPDMKSTYYYIDDKPANTAVANTYYVTLADENGRFGTSQRSTVSAYRMPNNTVNGNVLVTTTTLDKDTQANDLHVVTAGVDANTSVELSYVKLPNNSVNPRDMLEQDFKKVEGQKDNGRGQTEGWVKNLEEGCYYAARAVLTKGADKKVVYSTAISISYTSVSFNGVLDAAVVGKDAVVTVRDAINIKQDDMARYTYTVSYAKSSMGVPSHSTPSITLTTTSKWEDLGALTMVKYGESGDDASYRGVLSKKNLDEGYYVFRVVKAEKVGKKTKAAGFDVVQITAVQHGISSITASPSATVTAIWKRSERKFTTWNDATREVQITVAMHNGAETKNDAPKVKLWRAKLEKAKYVNDSIGASNQTFTINYAPVTNAVITQQNNGTPDNLRDDSFVCKDNSVDLLGGYSYFVTYQTKDGLLYSEVNNINTGSLDMLKRNLNNVSYYESTSASAPEHNYNHLYGGGSWSGITVKLTIE